MPPVTSTLHDMNRRQQILKAAEEVLAINSLESFTMDKVMKQAGVAKGTIYNYFKNKDEILAVLSSKALELLLSIFKEETAKHTHAVEKLHALCMGCYKFYSSNKTSFNLISYMERPEFDIDMKDYLRISEQLQKFCESIVIEGQSKGEIRKDIDPQATQLVCWAASVGVVQFLESKEKMLRNFHKIKLYDLMKTYADILTKGLR